MNVVTQPAHKVQGFAQPSLQGLQWATKVAHFLRQQLDFKQVPPSEPAAGQGCSPNEAQDRDQWVGSDPVGRIGLATTANTDWCHSLSRQS